MPKIRIQTLVMRHENFTGDVKFISVMSSHQQNVKMPETEQSAFLRLEDYSAPSMPTQDSVRRWYSSFLRNFRSLQKDDNDQSSLKDASKEVVDDAVQRPAYGSVVDDLNAEYLAWVNADDGSVDRVRLLVLPPCDWSNVIRVWAEQQSLNVLQAPSREAILQGVDQGSTEPIDGNDDTPIVIPRLEDFFVRHHRGLDFIRSMLATINQGNQRILIGCNAWAWHFLQASLFADKMLPTAQTLKPYNANRLQRWLRSMVEEDSDSELKLKFYGTYNQDDDADTPSKFYYQLAALSRGAPWIAWAMMRARLELEPDSAKLSQRQRRQNDDVTHLWISPTMERSIPHQLRSAGRLVLHSLLIHGPLTMDELKITVPSISDFNVVSGLQRLGLLEHDQQKFRCAAAMYHTIRSELSTAGFPMAEL